MSVLEPQEQTNFKRRDAALVSSETLSLLAILEIYLLLLFSGTHAQKWFVPSELTSPAAFSSPALRLQAMSGGENNALPKLYSPLQSNKILPLK